MKSTLHRILVALIIIVFLPLASITFYEYLKLDDQEKLQVLLKQTFDHEKIRDEVK